MMEQCINKVCGEDATQVIDGDAFCNTHADMVREMLARQRAAGMTGECDHIDCMPDRCLDGDSSWSGEPNGNWPSIR